MKTQHTKGPWFTDKQYTENFEEYFRICDALGVAIAKTPNIDPKSEFGQHQAEDFANAMLIAEAPRMLKALEQAIRCLAVAVNNDAFKDCALPNYGQHTLELCESVVAKAKGGI